MSGHNKWSKIKNKKAVEDSRRSKLFSMLVRTISTESRATGGDKTHPRLRTAIEKARAANMPMENIDRAVARGAGGAGESYESVTYETYGSGGAALVIEALTDNKNRTAAEIRHLLSKNGAEFASPGSALWAFTKNGDEWVATTTVPLSDDDGEKLQTLIEALEGHEDVGAVYTNAE